MVEVPAFFRNASLNAWDFIQEVDFMSCEVRHAFIDYSKYFKCWKSKGGTNHFWGGDYDTNEEFIQDLASKNT